MGCTNFLSHQQCINDSPFPCLHQRYYSLFWILDVLTVVRWYLIVSLICVCLMANNDEYLVIYLWAICIFYLENCPLKLFAHFSAGLVWFCCWVLKLVEMFRIFILCQKGFFFQFCPMPLNSIDNILCYTKASKLDIFPYVQLRFCCLHFWGLI